MYAPDRVPTQLEEDRGQTVNVPECNLSGCRRDGVSKIDIVERIAGGMIGLACGDALGAPAEFRSRAFIEQKCGRLTEMTGGGIWDPGEWTDDTGMTLCMADGILERPDDPVEAVGTRFLTWSKKAKDVGDTIASVLESLPTPNPSLKGGEPNVGDWAKASRTSPAARSSRAAGNGSLMRTLPVALAYPSAWEMLTVSARLSSMTHWDPQAETACAIYCLWIDALLRGSSMRDGWTSALDSARKIVDHGPLAPDTPGPSPLPDTFWQRLADVETRTYDQLQPTGYAGYVVDCLEAAVWCCLKAEDAEEAITLAVNLAGESDTIGAVAGGAAGVHWGVGALPARWTSVLFGLGRLSEVSQRLDELRRHNVVYAMPGILPFDYYRVAENLHAGRAPLTARDVRVLAEVGVTDFVDLRAADEWEAAGVGGEAVEMIETLGLRLSNFPITAAAFAASLDGVHAAIVSAMDNPLAHVYLFANSGRGRAAAVLAAILAAESMMSYDEVIDHLSDQLMKSSGARINPNEAQAEAVREWLRRR